MADRTVDLVIRAKNEATATIEAVANSLKGLSAGQDALGKSGSTTASTLTNLVGVIKDFATEAKALQDFGKAQAGVEQVNKALIETRSAAENAANRLTEVTAANDKLKASSAAATTAVNATKTALTEQRAAASEDARVLKELDQQIARTSASLAKLNEQKPSKTRTARGGELQGQLDTLNTIRPSVAGDAAASSGAANATRAQYELQANAARESARAVAESNSALGAAEANFTKLAAATARLTLADNELQAAASAAARQLDVEGRSSAEVTAKALRQLEAVKQLTAAEKSRGSAVPGFGSVTASATPQADLTRQYENLQQIKIAAQEANVALKAASVPTAEMATATVVLTDAAKQAETAFRANSAELSSYKAQLREAAEAARADAAAEEADALASQKAKQAKADEKNAIQAAKQAKSESAAISRSNAAAAAEEASAVKAAAAAEVAASRAAAAAAKENAAAHAASLKSIGSNFDSVTGHITTLIGAYVGFQAAYNALKEAVTVSAALEAAQVRLTLALNQGQEVGEQTFKIIADKARDLKLPILDAVNGFSQFAAAVKGTTLEGQTSVTMFQNLLTVGRAFKLDSSQFERANTALRDLAANGNVNLRFLRQLEQAIPVGLLDDLKKAFVANGGAISDFNKQLRGGGIGLDLLSQAFQHASDRAQTGLPAALDTVQSALANMGNAFVDAADVIGKAGLLDAVKEVANAIATGFGDPAGKDALRAIGHDAKIVGDILSAIIPFALKFRDVFIGLAAIQLGGYITGLGGVGSILAKVTGDSLTFARGLKTAEVAAGELAVGEKAIGIAAAESAGGIEILAGAFRTLLATPAGLLVTIGALAAGYLLLKDHTADAQSAADSYDSVLKTLEKTMGGTADEQKALNTEESGAPLASAKAALKEIQKAQDNLAAQGSKAVGFNLKNLFNSADATKEVNAVFDVAEAFRKGELSIDEYKQALYDLYDASKTQEGKNAVLDVAKPVKDIEKLNAEAAVTAQTIENITGKTKELDDIIAKAPNAYAEANDKAHALGSSTNDIENATKKYDDAMKALIKDFPELGREQKEAFKTDNIQKLIDKAKELDEVIKAQQQKGANSLASSYDKDAGTPGAKELEAQKAIDEGKLGDAIKARSTLPGEQNAIKGLTARIQNFEASGDSTNYPGKPAGHANEPAPESVQTGQAAYGQGQFLASTFIPIFKKAFPDEARGKSDADIARQRGDPEVAKAASEIYIAQIRAQLGQAGLPVTGGNTYLGYNLGVGGAKRLLAADRDAPAQSAIDKSAYDGNRKLYEGQTVGQILDKFDKKYGGTLGSGEGFNAETGKTKVETVNTAATESIEKALDKLKIEASRDPTKKADERTTTLAEQKQKSVEQFADPSDVTGKTKIKDYKQLNDEQKKLVDGEAEIAAKAYDVAHARGNEEATVKRVTDLESQRKQLIEDINSESKAGENDGLDEKKKKVKELTDEIKKLIPEAKKIATAFDDQGGIAALDKTGKELDSVKQKGTFTAQQVGEAFTSAAMGGIDTFFSEIQAGKKPIDALKDAFLKFASDFLKQIANMILKQTLMNAIMGGGSGGGGAAGGIAGGLNALFHEGGMVGTGTGMKRAGNPAWFVNAPRFHSGGMVGLANDEIPIIAQRGEMVMSKAQMNAAGRSTVSSNPTPIRNIVAIGDDQVAAALAGSHGEQVVMSHVKRNMPSIQKWSRT